LPPVVIVTPARTGATGCRDDLPSYGVSRKPWTGDVDTGVRRYDGEGCQDSPARHPGARRGPRRGDRLSRRGFWRVACRENREPRTWIPACAGMTVRETATLRLRRLWRREW